MNLVWLPDWSWANKRRENTQKERREEERMNELNGVWRKWFSLK